MKQAIIVRTDLKMGKGKMCAQASHASLQAFLVTQKKNPEWAELWLQEGQKKIVLKVSTPDALKEIQEEVRHELPTALVIDAGHTQVEPGSLTCLGVGPAPDPLIDKYFSHYRLL